MNSTQSALRSNDLLDAPQQLLDCQRCGEDAIYIKIEHVKHFARVRRASKCKRGKGDICKTSTHKCKSDVIAEWNVRFGKLESV